MTAQEALAQINDHPERYLQIAKHNGYICPICGSGSGKHGTGITENKGKPKHYTCFAGHCFTNASVVDILALKAGLTDTSATNFPKVIEAAAYEANIDLDDRDTYNSHKDFSFTGKFGQSLSLSAISHSRNDNIAENTETASRSQEKPRPIPSEYIARCRADLAKTDYLSRRGISPTTTDLFLIGYDKHFPIGNGQTMPAVIFFTGESSLEARNTDLAADSHERHRKQGKGQIFNLAALSKDKPIFVTEGIIDALSIIEVGGEAISAGGTSGVNLLLEAIQKSPVTAPSLILAFDNDEAGINAQERAKQGLTELNFPFEVVSKEFFGNAKDANEALCADRAIFQAKVQQAIEQSVTHSSLQGKSYKTVPKAQGVKLYCMGEYMGNNHFERERSHFANLPKLHTGLSNLDGELYSIYPGVYLIGGIPSSGKTSFALQIFDNLAKQGQDVLFFSAEQTAQEIAAKSLARLMFAHYGDVGGMSSIEIRRNTDMLQQEKIDRTVSEYQRTIAPHFSFLDIIHARNIDNVSATIEDFINSTGKTPCVCVDYLQVLEIDERLPDMERVAEISKHLRQIQARWGLPLFVVSSFNRSNYLSTVDFESFKGSGNLEYDADVILGLQLQLAGTEVFAAKELGASKDVVTKGQKRFLTEKAKNQQPRQMELVCLKNRYGGLFRCGFHYYSKHDCFVPDERYDEKWHEQQSQMRDSQPETKSRYGSDMFDDEPI